MAHVNPLFDETTGLAKLGTAAYVASTTFSTPTGNIATTTALQTPRSINDQVFDGTQDITITAQRPLPLIGDAGIDGFIPTETSEFIGAL